MRERETTEEAVEERKGWGRFDLASLSPPTLTTVALARPLATSFRFWMVPGYRRSFLPVVRSRPCASIQRLAAGSVRRLAQAVPSPHKDRSDVVFDLTGQAVDTQGGYEVVDVLEAQSREKRADRGTRSMLSSTYPSLPSFLSLSSIPRVAADPQPFAPVTSADSSQIRVNPVGIQLLSRSLHRQIFPSPNPSSPNGDDVNTSRQHLFRNHLLLDMPPSQPEINFQLPKLQGKTIDEHFYKLGIEVCFARRFPFVSPSF